MVTEITVPKLGLDHDRSQLVKWTVDCRPEHHH